MEELTYNDLPDQFTDETVRELRKMAEIQSPSWIDIFGKMTFEQERMYLEIKSRQTKEEFELEEALKQKKITQEDFDTKFRGWWTRFVNVDRHPSDLTIEDEIDALNDKTFYSSEKIKELFAIEFFNSYFLIPRTVGFIGNFLSQKRRDEGLFRLPEDEVFYE